MRVPCGTCIPCLTSKRADWSFRLQEEQKIAHSAHFLTMTYTDENMPYNEYGEEILFKPDTQLFLKRLRKANDNLLLKQHKFKNLRQTRQNTPRIRYYMVGEYGTKTLRPHYHAIIFNVQPQIIEKIDTIWSEGYTVIGKVEPASIHYCTKYVMTRPNLITDTTPKPFATMSRGRGKLKGLGSSYLANEKYHRENLDFSVKNSEGHIQSLPRYYKDKIFTKEQRAEYQIKMSILAIEQEDQEINRLERLGHVNPYSYLIEREKYNLSKIEKLISKSEKL